MVDYHMIKQLTLLVFLLNSSAWTQQHACFSFGPSLGYYYGSQGIGDDLSGGLSFNIWHKQKFLILRYMVGGNYFSGTDYSSKSEFSEFSIQYGFSKQNKSGFLSATVGPGRMKYFYSDGEGGRTKFRQIGVSFEGQAVLTPTKFFGLGFKVIGHINAKRTFHGFMLSLHLGHLY